MSDYFKYFPQIQYGGKVVTNITRRVKILDNIENDPYAYLPYTVKDNETPEEVAHLYYGDVAHVWIVWYSNNIVDPYFDWPLTYRDLEATLVKKYKVQAETDEGRELSDLEIVNWTMDTSTNENILYYYDSEGSRVTKDTVINAAHFFNGSNPSEGWLAMRIYESEEKSNEEKRVIRLLNRNYTDLATENLKRIMNGRK